MPNANQLTADTITDDQIQALQADALGAGDLVQVALCRVALADGLADIAEIDDSVRADLESLGVIPEHIGSDVLARGRCADAINAARAQEES